MKYIVSINNKNYEVEVERGQATVARTFENPVPVSAPPAAKPAAPIETVKAPDASSVSEGEKICAPMPGQILEVRKNTGDPVKKGEVVFIIEAMKMQNEIFAARDGVMRVFVSAGANVDTGDLLGTIL